MIYRIKNPYTYTSAKTITTLNSDDGDVFHIYPDGATKRSAISFTNWKQYIEEILHSSLEQEHQQLHFEEDETLAVDIGL